MLLHRADLWSRRWQAADLEPPPAVPDDGDHGRLDDVLDLRLGNHERAHQRQSARARDRERRGDARLVLRRWPPRLFHRQIARLKGTMRTLDGEQQLVRIFLGESDKWHHQPLYR